MAASILRPGTFTRSLIVLIGCSLFTADQAVAQTMTRVSVGPAGAQGNGGSRSSVISADGRWVAFWSVASTLVANDTNGVGDVFLHDRQTGITTRISVATGGTQGNGESSEMAISADGRVVAFESNASNLVAGDTNNRQDVFVHDRVTGQTTRVSIGPANTQANDNSWVPAISANGRWVTFDSWATNLVPGDTNATADIFVHDLLNGTTARASVGAGGAQANSSSYRPSISGGGRWVAFQSYASNLVAGDTNGLSDVFLHDQLTGLTTRASVGPGGSQGNFDSYNASLSESGRWIAFQSWSDNLVAGDTNARLDAFVHDQQTGVTTRVSIGPGGIQSNESSNVPVISSDGRWVAFDSWASNLVAADSNGTADAFVHDRQSGTTTRVSAWPTGSQGNSSSYWPAISTDGQSVAFYSFANNLVSGDTNGVEDVFVFGRAGTIAGTVTTAASQSPVANTAIGVYSSTGALLSYTYTNTLGAYTLPATLATGSYYLIAFPPQNAGLLNQLYPNVSCTSCPVTGGTPVAVTAPDATLNINFALTAAPAPGAFGKSGPADGSTRQPLIVTLSWGASSGAASYQFCYDTTNDNACTSWSSAGSATSMPVYGLLPNTTYYWHVRAVNMGVLTYADSGPDAFWSFTTGSASPLLDLNGDGKADVFTYNPLTGAWARHISQAAGGFSSTFGTWAPGWTVSMARFNTDALTDFFLFNPVTGAWEKIVNFGSAFSMSSSGQWWSGWQRHIVDLNGDGISDVFLYDSSTGTWFRSVSTTTGFSYSQGAWNPGWEIHPVTLNTDAFDDLFLIDRTTGRWFWVLGGTSFTYPVSETWFPDWKLYRGDFNGDGRSDFLLHDPPTGTFFVASNTGAGFTYVQGGWSLGWTPRVADLNADGLDDLFLHDASTGTWFEMIGNGSGSFTSAGGQTWSLGWTIHVTDFNGDRRADVLLYDPETGAWYEARNLTLGAFAYTSGTWTSGLTVIVRLPGS